MCGPAASIKIEDPLTIEYRVWTMAAMPYMYYSYRYHGIF